MGVSKRWAVNLSWILLLAWHKGIFDGSDVSEERHFFAPSRLLRWRVSSAASCTAVEFGLLILEEHFCNKQLKVEMLELDNST